MKRTDSLITWYGELTTRQQLLKRGSVLLVPGMLWLMLFLVLPSLVLVVVSLVTRGAYGELEWVFTLENYKRLAGFTLFGWTADYLLILWRSIVVAAVTTFVSVLLSYPLCFFIAARPQRSRYMWLTLVIIPFWTNMVIRAYAWFLILSPEMPFARLAAMLGFIPEGAPLYPNAFAVYLGMVSMFLPFVTLPLYASVERLDWSLVGSGPGSLRFSGARFHPGHFAPDHARVVGGDHFDIRSRHGDVRGARPARRRQIYAGWQSHPAAVRHQPGLAFRCGHQYGTHGADNDRASDLPA
jgi:ABC-type spermidine/putrescine transport system permease subunit II